MQNVVRKACAGEESKQEDVGMQDMTGLPEIHLDDCDGCGACVPVCPVEALRMVDHKVTVIKSEDCQYCGACEEACPTGAISCPYEIVIEEAS